MSSEGICFPGSLDHGKYDKSLSSLLEIQALFFFSFPESWEELFFGKQMPMVPGDAA